ncbi:MAG: hypothetical protein Q8M08_17230 [Bacteroidales bacterium]|nr:hypothetical protein [Bacteroidales bacterium]
MSKLASKKVVFRGALNEKGQMLTVVAGYQKAAEFEGVLSYFGKDAYLKSTWEEYRATFKGELK